ncbi:MAG: glycosyl transferase [Peptococcaceae bacterium]|nr:glycosyl transferase [Peptococcaceae bacterium]
MLVTVVIPAFNEENYLGGVLEPLKSIPEITQIIVVSDGSTDGTVQVARNWGVEVIDLPQNLGKGGAMSMGVKTAREDIILFLDADLIGLKVEHVQSLIYPVLNNEADMTVGVFGGGRLATDVAQLIAPFLSGQRCIKKYWLEQIANLESMRFGVETAITQFAYENNLRIMEVELPAMSHVMKEEKLGFVKGFAYRLKMYWEIAKNVRLGG